MTSNNLTQRIVVATLAAALLLPLFATAASADTGVMSGSVSAGTTVKVSLTGFCARIGTADVTNELERGRKNLLAERLTLSTELVKRQEQLDERLGALRDKEDKVQGEVYVRLAGRATTDVQKQAVAQFKADVSAALSARRTAVTAANVTFRAGLKDALAARKTSLDSAVSAFITSMKAALTQAKSDCTGGASPDTARATYLASVKAAQDKLKSDRQAAEKVGPQLQTIVATRRAAIDKAFADFKAAVEKARAALKLALGTSATTSASTGADVNAKVKVNDDASLNADVNANVHMNATP